MARAHVREIAHEREGRGDQWIQSACLNGSRRDTERETTLSIDYNRQIRPHPEFAVKIYTTIYMSELPGCIWAALATHTCS